LQKIFGYFAFMKGNKQLDVSCIRSGQQLLEALRTYPEKPSTLRTYLDEMPSTLKKEYICTIASKFGPKSGMRACVKRIIDHCKKYDPRSDDFVLQYDGIEKAMHGLGCALRLPHNQRYEGGLHPVLYVLEQCAIDLKGQVEVDQGARRIWLNPAPHISATLGAALPASQVEALRAMAQAGRAR
jgi:hypothetical protein